MLFSFYCRYYCSLVRISRIKGFYFPVLFILLTAHNDFNRLVPVLLALGFPTFLYWLCLHGPTSKMIAFILCLSVFICKMWDVHTCKVIRKIYVISFPSYTLGALNIHIISWVLRVIWVNFVIIFGLCSQFLTQVFLTALESAGDWSIFLYLMRWLSLGSLLGWDEGWGYQKDIPWASGFGTHPQTPETGRQLWLS